MSDREYNITEEQFRKLRMSQDNLAYYMEALDDLCGKEKDDIVYGYALGRLCAQMSTDQRDIMILLDKIKV